ncbi:g5309 [Coccomyxa viridis]|uniref:G5309 protein n=1 Tax=Coccomyxa viridis TaxID=1274662 RepID=A0ABP1FZ81_9CHLO
MRLCSLSAHARVWPQSPQAAFQRCRRICAARALQEGGGENFLTTELQAGSKLAWLRKDLHVVLVHPQIPQNTGTIARTCAATGVGLHLVGPLGFEIDNSRLKRAGLDYWPYVAVNVYSTWQDFYGHFQEQEGPKRLLGFSKAGKQHYASPSLYRKGDWLLFGAETTGLPGEAYASIEESSGEVLRIPITETHVRSLNLAVSAGVALYEAMRQLDGPH